MFYNKLISMLRKKKAHQQRSFEGLPHSHPSHLSKLQEIAQLQRQLVSFLGPKNVDVDTDNHLLSRLQQLYIKHLQSQPLGLQVLDKIATIIGDADAPARIRILYLLAHELYLAGQSPMKILQQASQGNLSLKIKLITGYKCGLVLSQLSACPRLVQSTLGSIVVVLEKELNFRPNRTRQVQLNRSRTSAQSLKSVYIGGRGVSKNKGRSNDYSKLEKLELNKCLYEAYLTGAKRLQSQAKRRYYSECQEELGRRMMREYPGMNILSKLQDIEEGATASREFTNIIQPAPSKKLTKTRQPFSQTTPEPMWIKSKRGSTQDNWNKSEGFKEVSRISRTGNQNMMASDYADKMINVELRSSSRISRRDILGSSSRQGSSHRTRLKRKSDYVRQQADKQNIDKSIVLKFERLPHKVNRDKPQIRKRKFKGSIHWEEKQSNNVLESVMSVSYSPSKRQQQPEQNEKIAETAVQTDKKQVRSNTIVLKEDDGEIMESQMLIAPSQNSDKRIDNLLKEGVDFLASFGDVNSDPNRQSSSVEVLEKGTYEKLQSFTVCVDKRSYQRIQSDAIIQTENMVQAGKPQIRNKSASIQKDVEETELEPKRMVFLEIEKEGAEQIKANISRADIEKSINIGDIERILKERERPLELHNDDLRSSKCSSQQSIQYKIIINNEEGDVIIEEIETSIMKPIINEYFQSLYSYLVEKELSKSLHETKSSKKSKKSCRESQKSSKGSRKSGGGGKDESTMSQTKMNEGIKESIVEIVGIKDSLKSSLEKKLQKPEGKFRRESHTMIKKTDSIDIAFKLFDHGPDRFSKQVVTDQISNQYVDSLFQEIIDVLSNSDNSYRKTSLSCELKDLANISQKIEVIQECQDSSFDDKDLSSEAPSDKRQRKKSKDSTPYSPFNRSEEQKKSFKSNFTCSRFACSKIEEKESATGQVSQLNIVEEFIRNIDGEVERSDVMSSEGATARKTRSRVQSCAHSEQSSNCNFNERRSSLKKRESGQLSVACLWTDNYDTAKEEVIQLEHWLKPVLSIGQSRVNLRIINLQKGNEAEKSRRIPGRLVCVPDILRRQIMTNLHVFLDKFKDQERNWDKVVEEFTVLQLISDNIPLLELELREPNLQQNFMISIEYSLDFNSLSVTFDPFIVKSHQLCLDMNSDLKRILDNIHPQKLLVTEGELIFVDLWTKVGQRSIKLRDKYENTTVNCSFSVYEILKNNSFHYKIKGKTGEQMNFSSIDHKLRKKVLANIDTIIGYAIKLTNKKVVFSQENINQLIRLL